MLALGRPDEDFDVGLLEGRAELLDVPSSELLPASHLAKYRAPMAAIGLTPDEFLATYTQVIRIVPTRYLPWHGRTQPKSGQPDVPTLDRRLAAAIRRVASTVGSSGAPSPFTPRPRVRLRLVTATPGQVRRRAFRSARISRAAFWPGWPVTPPPGWAPEPAR